MIKSKALDVCNTCYIFFDYYKSLKKEPYEKSDDLIDDYDYDYDDDYDYDYDYDYDDDYYYDTDDDENDTVDRDGNNPDVITDV